MIAPTFFNRYAASKNGFFDSLKKESTRRYSPLLLSISKGIEDIHSVQGDHNDQQDDQNPADGNDGVQLL